MPKSNARVPREGFLPKLLKDPLLHFLLLGGLLYLSAPLWKQAALPKNEIRITHAGRQHLADLFTLTWQRPPRKDELENLVQEHIKEEIYYREALALGLDGNDTIVRRRLRQKLEFMQEDLSIAREPTQIELQKYFKTHQREYNSDRILSFKQVLVSTKKLESGAPDINNALDALRSGALPKSISRSSLLPVSMKLETEKSVSNTFGGEFLGRIAHVQTGKWHGPIVSTFGTHLVFISLDQAAKPLGFEAALPRVRSDFVQAKRRLSAENYYNNLRKNYKITIEKAQ